MPEIAMMIYYSTRKSPGLYINQYIESEGRITLSDGNEVFIDQITDYPYNGKTEIGISLERESIFPIKLRIPSWSIHSGSGIKIYVNNELETNSVKGDFYEIKRKWKNGDKIKIEFTLDWRLIKGRKYLDGTCAVMRGPVLYSLNPPLSNLRSSRFQKVQEQIYHKIMIDPDALTPHATETIDGAEYHTCTVSAWMPGWERRIQNLGLLLTDFAHPDSTQTHFLIDPDTKMRMMDDELFNPCPTD